MEQLEGTAKTQAELEPRLRGRARAELGLLREEPGLEARGGNDVRRGLKNKRTLWQNWCWGWGQNQGPQILDLVSCSPGQLLEGREKGGEAPGKDLHRDFRGEFLSAGTES